VLTREASQIPATVILARMVEAFFGLSCEPFSVAPNPRFLYLSEQHREALSHLQYGLHRGAGFVLLTGEIGAGKTTVWRHFLEQLPPHFDVANVVNPRLSVRTLLMRVCEDLGIELPAGDPDPDLIDLIHGHLLLASAQGRRTLIVVDEAQALSADVFEQLRLLTNLDTSGGKLQVLLIGQPELRGLLERPEMEPLAQRVVARYHLAALSPAETARYIAHRMAVAGLQGALPFDDEALQRVHQLCGGVPRRINVLCDRALLVAQTLGQRHIGRAVVERAAAEAFGRVHATSGRAPAVAPAAPPSAAPTMAAPAAAAPAGTGRFVLAGLGVTALAVGLVVLGPMALRAWPTGRPAPAAPGAAPSPTAGAAPAVAPQVTLTAAPTLSTTPSITPSTTPSTTPPATPPATRPATAAPLVALAPAAATARPSTPTATPAATLDGLFAAAAGADEAPAWRALAGLWGLSLAAGDPCERAARHALHCYRARGGLMPIRQLARPGILKLVDSRGRSAHVLLTGLSEDSATVRAGDTEQRVPLALLAQAWRGDFATFWRAPPQYRPGDVAIAGSPLGAWLGERLARLDGGAPAPADDEALKARVFAFQLAHGLPPDGVAGPLTMMQLNRASGVEEPRLQAAR